VLHSGWLESEVWDVAKWRGLGRNGREVECKAYSKYARVTADIILLTCTPAVR